MTTKPRRIIYIVGVGHSGSTILEMLLTTAGRAVGLGEAWATVGEPAERIRSRSCSCGASADACELWRPVIDGIALLPPSARQAGRYQILLDRVRLLFGEDVAVIDSSKKPDALNDLSEAVAGADVRVLHNVRDVRAHTISVLDKARREGGRGLPWKAFRDWYVFNRLARATALQVLGVPPMLVTHEALCLETDVVVGRLEEWLGDEYVDRGAKLNSGTIHSIRGNRVRLPEHAEQASRLRYDYEWFTRREWIRPYILMPKVRQYNEECLSRR